MVCLSLYAEVDKCVLLPNIRSLDRQELGTHRAVLRKQKGWDQSELGRRADVSRAFVCNLEQGTGEDPGLQKILHILNLFSKTLVISDRDEPPTLIFNNI